jgi:hypothetical protein
MACRQGGELHAPGGKQGPAADEKRVGPLTLERSEGYTDLRTVAGIENLDLQGDGAASVKGAICAICMHNPFCEFDWALQA